jgi:Rieske Fe-S protein
LPFGFLWYKSVERKEAKKKQNVILPATLPHGVSFHNKVIAVNSNEDLKVYSSRCSHLGCTINKIENDKLVCPCHGSTYNLNGKVIKGPASNPLKELKYKIDSEKGEIIVELV